MMINQMSQTNRDTMFQTEQRKRVFEDKVAEMQ